EFRMITTRPSLVRLTLVAPRKRKLQIGVAPQSRFALVIKNSRFGQPAIDARRPRLIVNPSFQPFPVANQTLVRYVYQRIRVEPSPCRRHQKRFVFASKDFDNLNHFRFAGFRKSAEFFEFNRAANLSIVRSLFSETSEYLFSNLPASLVGQFVIGFVGVKRERRAHPSYRFVMLKVYRLIFSMAFFPVAPCSHQRVLKNRQLIGIVSHVIEQPIDQTRSYVSATDGYRPRDGFAALLACQSRDQILSFVYCFGQIPE